MTIVCRYLMADLDAAGVRLQLDDGDRLMFHPKAIPAELVERLKASKSELVAMLHDAKASGVPFPVDPVFVRPPCGWTPEQWRDRLLERSESCKAANPDCAWEYQATARTVARLCGVAKRENQQSEES